MSTSQETIPSCCLKGFAWSGTPSGTVSKLGNNDVYIAKPPNASTKAAILFIHDGYGWTFGNIRLLADHYAKETGYPVYVPDFFGGEVIPSHLLAEGRWAEIDMPSFLKRNSREKREPEIFACAHALHSLGFEKLGAVGFCFGGWACFRLAAESSVLLNGAPLIDVISVGNPSLLTKEDVDGLKDGSVVKVQILAPEKDPVFTEELKRYTFERFLEKRIAFDWRAFPGVVHGSLVRGGEDHVGERDAMVKAKDAVVRWMREGLEY